MAETLKARAGSSLKARFQYRQPDGTLVDTTGSTARVSIRALNPTGRVVLEATESDTPGSTLEAIEPGHWRLFLSGAVTKILPSTVLWEVELVNDSNTDDVTPLASGTILTSPEQVKNLD